MNESESMTSEVMSDLPEDKTIRNLRKSVIICNIVGLAIFLFSFALGTYYSYNDPTGWSVLGAVMIFLYFGLPVYGIGFLLLIAFWIIRALRKGTYRNSYGRTSTTLLWSLSVSPLVIVAWGVGIAWTA